MPCQDRDCQKHVDEVYRELYGHEGSGNGIKREVKKLSEEVPRKLSVQSVKKYLFFVAVPVVLLLGGTGANMYAIQQSMPHQYAEKGTIAKHETRLIVLEENCKHIKEQLKGLNEIKRTNQMILSALKDLAATDDTDRKKSGADF